MTDAAKDAVAASKAAQRAGDAMSAKAFLQSAIGASQAAAARCVSQGEDPKNALAVQGEAHVTLAELLWQQGAKRDAVQNYEAALAIVRRQGDRIQEGMVSLGMGYALLNSGDTADLPGAVAAMRCAKDLAVESGHTAQVGFVYAMLEQAEQRLREVQVSAAPSRSEEDEQAAMLRAFVRSLTSRSSVMLFMKGAPLEPECGFSLRAARALMELEINFDAVDVQQDLRLRNAIKSFSEWPTFPQIWVGGRLLGGSDIIDELQSEGMLLKEIAAQLRESSQAGWLLPTVGGDGMVEGTAGLVPRKLWPTMPSEVEKDPSRSGNGRGSGCHHGHHQGSEVGSGKSECKHGHYHSDTGCDAERWQLRVSRRHPELGYQHSQHETDDYPWVVEITQPTPGAAVCNDVRGGKHDVHHLSEDARAWMVAHPDERLPLHLCPTHGDCGTCPERHDCKWHDRSSAPIDIEDYRLPAHRPGTESHVESPESDIVTDSQST